MSSVEPVEKEFVLSSRKIDSVVTNYLLSGKVPLEDPEVPLKTIFAAKVIGS